MNRCTDYRLIKRVLGIYPVISEEVIYLQDQGENIWTIENISGCFRVHANMKTLRGRHAIKSAEKAFYWFFANTGEKLLTARIERDNRKACVIARACMNFVGADEKFHYYEVEDV